MVHDLNITRHNFNMLQNAVERVVDRHREAAVHITVRSSRRVHGHRDRQIGVRDGRSACRLRRFRRIGGVALWRAPFHPGCNGSDLDVRQTALMSVALIRQIGRKRRHLPIFDGTQHGLRHC